MLSTSRELQVEIATGRGPGFFKTLGQITTSPALARTFAVGVLAGALLSHTPQAYSQEALHTIPPLAYS